MNLLLNALDEYEGTLFEWGVPPDHDSPAGTGWRFAFDRRIYELGKADVKLRRAINVARPRSAKTLERALDALLAGLPEVPAMRCDPHLSRMVADELFVPAKIQSRIQAVRTAATKRKRGGWKKEAGELIKESGGNISNKEIAKIVGVDASRLSDGKAKEFIKRARALARKDIREKSHKEDAEFVDARIDAK